MSFSGETKACLASLGQGHECCDISMLYGMVTFSPHADNGCLSFTSETPEVTDRLSALLISYMDIAATPEIFKKKNGSLYRILVENRKGNERLFDGVTDSGFTQIDREKFVCRECLPSFLRGVFLACGYVNPPGKEFRLELTVENPDHATELAVLLNEKFGMPRLAVRGGKQVVFYKTGEATGDFLSFIGAKKQSFDIMNWQFERELRNNTNRQNNFDIANIDKSASAAAAQLNAINTLISSGEFEKLPPELRAVGRLRLQYPEYKLSELASLTDPPSSKSHICKLLKKLTDTANSKKG